MALTNDLISQFVKATKDTEQKKTETTCYGTVKVQNGTTYVQLDGSELLTPAVATASTKDGERVIVTIKNHTAIITGNISSPAARVDDIEDVPDIVNKIAEFEILIADKVSSEELEAEVARIDAVIADNVLIRNQLSAAEADIDNLQTNVLTVTGQLTAVEADITRIETEKLDVNIAVATYATITNLESTNTTIHNLESTYAEFVITTTSDLIAMEADIAELEANRVTTEYLESTYANIDFSNIDKVAMEYFYSQSGLIKNVQVGDATISGELVGVTIKGDLLEGNTVKADKLVIKGSDGLYYKLNTDGMVTEKEQTDQNSLNGQIIKAKSITASKINVDDLVAFDATIGGFKITENSIYSGVKSSVDNTTRGIYMDKDGQIAFGDGSNYIKYYRASDGSYKIDISAGNILLDGKKVSDEIEGSSKTATNFLSHDATNGLQIGDKSSGSWKGLRAQITSQAFRILDSTGQVLSSYGDKLIELGKNATDAIIKFCGGKGQIEYDADAQYLQLTGDQVRIKGDSMSSLYCKTYDGSSTASASSVNVSSDRVDMFSQRSNDIDPDTHVGTWKTSEASLIPEGLTVVADEVNVTSRGDMNFQTVEGDITFNGTTLLDLFYPVGSIYMSTVYFDPGTKFGGKWERLMDKFLLGSGAVYANGQTGGEATHTLSVLEMPKHQHAVGYANTGAYVTLNGGNNTGNYNIPWTANAGYSAADLVALESGGGNAHNNMPPYLAVNMWKRIE